MSAASSVKRALKAEHAIWPLRLQALAEEGSAEAGPCAGRPAVAGMVPFSSVDWPGQLAAVVFIGGCPWRCHYCHNPHLQQRSTQYDWHDVLAFLDSRRGLLDGVVFSGGEPLSEHQLPQMMAAVKALGFRIALHTAGMYPQRLAAVLPMLDWVGLDIKSDHAGYDALTARPRSAAAVDSSLDLLLQSRCTFECRTTWSPRWLTENALLELAQQLSQRGVQHYAVQNYRAAPGAAVEGALGEPTLHALQSAFKRFEYR